MVNAAATLESPVTSRHSTSRRTRQTSRQATRQARQSITVSDFDDTDSGECNSPAGKAERITEGRRKAAVQRAILEWEAAKEKAQNLYGEMGALEDQIIAAMHDRGEKSLRLSDGRVLVVLESFKDPMGCTEIYADHIQVIEAGVVPKGL